MSLVLSDVKKLTKSLASELLRKYESIDAPSRNIQNPKSGDCIIIMKSDFPDHLVDQYKWHQGGEYQFKDTDLTRVHYYIKTTNKGPRQYDNKFTKSVFSFVNGSKFLIHYSGDDGKLDLLPHGNAKCSTPFNRTLPSTRKLLKEHCEKPLNRFYFDAKKRLQEENSVSDYDSDQTDFFERHVSPKNIQQLKNVKKSVKQSQSLHFDEFYSIKLLHECILDTSIIKYQIIPSVMVVLTHPQAISLTNQLLEKAKDNANIKQCLSYDTTFELADYYVSILIAKNTDLKGDPIYPVGYLVHERKWQESHESFFGEVVKNRLKLNKNIPIVTDRETAISNSIKKISLDENLIYCHNHILTDIKQWLMANGAKQDIPIYKKLVKKLLASKTQLDFNLTLNELKNSASKPFLQYFTKNIENDIKNYSAPEKYTKFPIFSDFAISPTNNMSESFNHQFKAYVDHKKQKLDQLCYTLIKYQLEMFAEFDLAIKGLGKYRVKKNLSSEPIYSGVKSDILNYTCQTLMKKVKEEIGSPKDRGSGPEEMLNSVANNTYKERLIGFDHINRVYTVKDAITGKVNAVSKVNGELKCSCKLETGCFHVRTVKLMEGEIESSPKLPRQLSQIIRKKGEGAGGKKFPRKNDVVPPYFPAPDSTKARTKLNFETDLFSNTNKPFDVVYASKKSNDYLRSSTPTPDFVDEEKLDRGDDKSGESMNASINSSTSEDLGENSEKPYFLESIPENPKSYRFRDVSSLRKQRFIKDYIINNSILQMMNTLKVFDKWCYVPNYVYLSIYNIGVNKAKNNLVLHLHHRQALNKDGVIVLINTDKKEGIHWLIGLILFNVKKIVIFDSLDSCYNEPFKNLVFIAWISHLVANTEFNLDNWSLHVASDGKRQDDGFDCGAYAVYHSCKILTGNGPNFATTELRRNWIKWILSKAPQEFDEGERKRPLPTKLSEKLKKSVDINPINYIRKNCLPFVAENEKHNNLTGTKCSAPICYNKVGKKKEGKMDFCVVCRNWYHRFCHDSAIDLYFICTNCV